MDRTDIAREALEDVKLKLGALMARTPIHAQPDEMVDAYGVTLRALRRLDAPFGSQACPVVLTHARTL